MNLSWNGTGTYTLPEGDNPDYPIEVTTMEGGNYLRGDSGALYNPSKYTYEAYSFNFSGITSATVDAFVTLFRDADITSFTIADADFGTSIVIPVPGSLSVAYFTLGNCNLSFRVEERLWT